MSESPTKSEYTDDCKVSRPGTAPSPEINRQCQASKSVVVREGVIVAVMNREYDSTITRTGRDPTWP